MFYHQYLQTKSTLTMDKNLLQKAKAPMIALIQTKNIMNNNLKTKTKRAAALLLMLLMLAPLAAWAQVTECRRPTELAASSIESNSAILSWVENGPATSWIVAYATSNDNDYTEVDAPTNPFTLTGLVPATQYIVKVLPVCEVEKWSDEITFTTQCGPITITTDAPYTQDFESPQGTEYNVSGPLPDCWEGYSNGGVVPHNTTRFYHSGAQSLSLCKSTWFDDSYAILPEFSNPLHQLQISFYVRTVEGSYDIPLLGYITADDNGTCNTFTPIASYALGSWLQYTQELHIVPATAARLVFRWSGDKDDCCCIDDVVVSLSPLDCYQVGALDLGEVSANSAYLSWDLIDAEQTAWDVQVATDATFTENMTNLVATTHENYLLTGLNAASYYYVRVKPQCDDDFWSNTISFGTLCDGPVTITADAPYTEGFESPWGNNSVFESGCLPVCWEGYSTIGVIPHNFTGGFHSGTQSLSLGNSSWGDYYAVLPEFSNAIGELQVGFWMVTQNPYGGTSQLQLGYLTAEDDGTCNTFAEIATYDNPDSGMEQRITYLTFENVPATAQRLAFKWHGEGRWCFIDDVEVSICTLDCFPVGAISVNSSSANSAYLTWNLIDNSQTAWDVQVATNEDFTENVTNSVADIHENYLIDGLSGSTTYYVRVKPACSEDLWSNAISFWTSVLCDGPITITADTPYIESFESPTGTNYWESGLLPSCWEAYSTGTVAPHNTLNYAHSGSQCLTFRPPGNHYAILPEFGNPLDELQINFWITIVELDHSMQLGYLTAEDDGTCNTFTAIATYTNTTESWTHHTAYLEFLDVPATAQRLAFKWSGGYCYFDDVEVSLAPNCYPVDNLSLGEVTSNSAYLSWDLVDNSQTAWDVQVSTNAAFTDTIAEYVADSHENYLLSGLSGITHYYVRVKPTCSDDLWSAIDFETPCGTFTVTANAPYTQGFESPGGTLWTQHGLLPPCWEGYNNSSYPTPHNTIGSYGAPHIVHSGEQCLSFHNNSDCYAILPEFSNPISDLQINFWMATNGNTTDKLRLGYITTEDDGTCNTFTEIASYDSNFGSMGCSAARPWRTCPPRRIAWRSNGARHIIISASSTMLKFPSIPAPIPSTSPSATSRKRPPTSLGKVRSAAMRFATGQRPITMAPSSTSLST